MFSGRAESDVVGFAGVVVSVIHDDGSLQPSKNKQSSCLQRQNKCFFFAYSGLCHRYNFLIEFELAGAIAFTADFLNILFVFVDSESYNRVSTMPIDSTTILHVLFD